MDVPEVIAGALFVVWPLQYRWHMGKIESRIAARGDDPERFRRRMNTRATRIALVVAPVAGICFVVLGLTGN